MEDVETPKWMRCCQVFVLCSVRLPWRTLRGDAQVGRALLKAWAFGFACENPYTCTLMMLRAMLFVKHWLQAPLLTMFSLMIALCRERFLTHRDAGCRWVVLFTRIVGKTR